MQKSLIIARLVGPVLSAIGIGMLVNQPTYREMAGQFIGGLPFIYLSGILALVAGLYILNVHKDFSSVPASFCLRSAASLRSKATWHRG